VAHHWPKRLFERVEEKVEAEYPNTQTGYQCPEGADDEWLEHDPGAKNEGLKV